MPLILIASESAMSEVLVRLKRARSCGLSGTMAGNQLAALFQLLSIGFFDHVLVSAAPLRASKMKALAAVNRNNSNGRLFIEPF